MEDCTILRLPTSFVLAMESSARNIKSLNIIPHPGKNKINTTTQTYFTIQLKKTSHEVR